MTKQEGLPGRVTVLWGGVTVLVDTITLKTCQTKDNLDLGR